MNDLKTRIQDVLKAFPDGPLIKTAGNLLNILGYRSDKTFSLRPNDYKGFADYFLQRSNAFDAVRARTAEWQSVDILFQLTEDELKTQHTLFEIREVDNRIIESYLFFAVELTGEAYTRGDLVRITREINKLTPMPSMLLFFYNHRLTIAVIDRRLNKNEHSRDVLEKVTLIKDIDCIKPHRAHIEILHDLALDELRRRHGFTNFIELHRAWQKTLDITELNRRFFKEIADWYFWAVKKVRYPNPYNLTEQHNHSLNVIRLLTRLIFCWFLKEKRLIPESLFDYKELSKILAKPPLELGKGDPTIYYKAILQNLFFATLNTDMNKDIPGSRRFITGKKSAAGVSEEYSVPTVFRHRDLFREKENAIKYFEDIPFLNGGLFECLDTFETIRGKNVETRIDGFSSSFSKQPVVPDELFFTEDTRVNLSGDYGNPKYSDVRVRGLIRILENYKFTIEENTPVEEEIALDPELLGKVFENLLANFNPETQTTARKQTGSFYTPREIVNYMVDESLLRYLEDRLMEFHDTEKKSSFQSISSVKRGQRTRKEGSTIRDKLRHLLSYGESGHLFRDKTGADTPEISALIEAINECKILDPACGSGAFPMGVLHKMVLILGKLDPFNRQWKQAQLDKAMRDRQRAERMEDDEIRRLTLDNIEQRVRAIEEAFGSDRHELDYTRKLFLIENCIYGVDIQNIAVQIAKLRFFISLVVDQKVMDDRPNRNILALPNLETKFVAANTLIGIDKPQQELELGGGKVYAIENELKNLRQKLFYTKKYIDKKKLRLSEKAKREDLKRALIENHYSTKNAEMIASWNPFDPVHAADFFEVETMFGISNGFNIVIGNPPYISALDFTSLYGTCLRAELNATYKTAKGSYDIYVLFIEKGIELINSGGVLAFITPNKYLSAKYAVSLREYILTNASLYHLVDLSHIKVFQETSVYPIVTFLKKGKDIPEPIQLVLPRSANVEHFSQDDFYVTSLPRNLLSAMPENIWGFLLSNQSQLLSKIIAGTEPLGMFGSINATSTAAEADEYGALITNGFKDGSLKVINTGTIDRYVSLWGIHEMTHAGKRFLMPCLPIDSRAINNRRIIMYKSPKIIFAKMAKRCEAFIDTKAEYSSINTNCFYNPQRGVSLQFIGAFCNSSLFTFIYGQLFGALRMSGGYYQFQSPQLRIMPLKRVNPDIQVPFIKFVDKIIDAKRSDPDAFTLPLEAQIDAMFAHLYNLTEEEYLLILSQLSLPDPERVAAANAYRDVERGFIK